MELLVLTAMPSFRSPSTFHQVHLHTHVRYLTYIMAAVNIHHLWVSLSSLRSNQPSSFRSPPLPSTFSPVINLPRAFSFSSCWLQIM